MIIRPNLRAHCAGKICSCNTVKPDYISNCIIDDITTYTNAQFWPQITVKTDKKSIGFNRPIVSESTNYSSSLNSTFLKISSKTLTSSISGGKVTIREEAEEEEDNIKFVKISPPPPIDSNNNNSNPSEQRLRRKTISDCGTTSRSTSNNLVTFRVEYHKRRASISSTPYTETADQNSMHRADPLEDTGKRISSRPISLGVQHQTEQTLPKPETNATPTITNRARRPPALLSSPTSTAPPPSSFIPTTVDGAKRRPTSLFMSNRFVPSLSSTTPALYTEAEGSKRILMFGSSVPVETSTSLHPDNSDSTKHTPLQYDTIQLSGTSAAVTPTATLEPAGVQQQQPYGILGAAIRQLTTPTPSIIDDRGRSGFTLPLSSTQFRSAATSSSSLLPKTKRYAAIAGGDDDNYSLYSPTAVGGGTLTATSPSTFQALQVIAELASPTNATGLHDPVKMVSVAAAASSYSFNPLDRSAPTAVEPLFPVTADIIKTLSADELAAKMTKPRPFLLLDCRSALTYDKLHIIGAANINCADKSSRKRLQLGRVVGELINSKEARALYRKRIMRDVIVYDESTFDAGQLAPIDPLILVISALIGDGKEVALLSGGFNTFQTRYSHLCDKSAGNGGRRQLLPPLLSIECSADNTPSTPGSVAFGGSSTSVPPTPGVDYRESRGEREDAERAEISPVLRGLYLGNERDAAAFERLQQLKITHIVNITTHIPCHHIQQGITYLRLPASDSPRQDLFQHFREAFDFIDKARKDEGNVLVHCQAGISRSATITVSYVMRACGLSMQEAYKLVKQKRSVISPNLNFMGQLFEYEKQLNLDQQTAAASHASPDRPSLNNNSNNSNNNNNGGASRPNSAKSAAMSMVTQSIFEKKPLSISSPRTSLASASFVSTTQEPSTISPGGGGGSGRMSNKRPGEEEQRYPVRAMKRPMSLKLSTDVDVSASKSAPNTLQNEENEAHQRRVLTTFGISFSPVTSAAVSSSSSSAALLSGNSENAPAAGVHGAGGTVISRQSPGGSKIRSPLTPTNDYQTLLVTTQPQFNSSSGEAQTDLKEIKRPNI